jgi:CRISPR-associated protein Csc3
MSEKPRERIDELARLAFDVARPTSFKPYAVERVFRESVKAVTETGTTRPGRQDCVYYVSGRIQKMIDRSEQVYPVSGEKANSELKFSERVDAYSEYFVDEVLFGICDGRPSRLKRLSNNLSDGFYAATLSLVRANSEDTDNHKSGATDEQGDTTTEEQTASDQT